MSEIEANTINEIQFETCNLPNLDDSSNTLGALLDNEYTKVSNISGNQTCIDHDDLTRCWYTYVPESAKSSTDPVPIVVDLHRFTSCAYVISAYSGWARMAEEHGFIVIWPQGNIDAGITDQTCWNAGSCCCEYYHAETSEIDDAGFLRQAISNTVDSVSDEVTIDTKRIYFAGHSNGCVMSQTMAADHSDLVAAVCCHSGFAETDVSSDYQPTPIQTVHGDLDAVTPYNKTVSSWTSLWGVFEYDDAVESFEFWGDTNGCKQKLTNVDASELYATHSFLDCIDNATVKLVQVFNSGHSPYLGANLSSVGEPNENMTTVDTTQLSWDFCSAYESASTPSLPEPVPYVSPYIFSDGSYLHINVIPYALLLVYFMFKL